MRAESTAQIPLMTYGGVAKAYALVDLDDYERLSQFGWWIDNNGYARGYIGKQEGRKVYAQMARYLLDAPPHLQVDHINRNPLDNRRVNLRLVTQAENAQNRSKRQKATSKHRGVYWNKSHKRWVAQGKVGQRWAYIGSFKREEDAAAAAAEWRKTNMPYSEEALAGMGEKIEMTAEQEARRVGLARSGEEVRAFKVPEGSVIFVRSDARAKPNWFEVAEPDPKFLLCWDISDW